MIQEYQNNNLENMIAKKNEPIKGKETFKANLEKLFIDFKNDSFNPLYGRLKQNIFLIFDDYKNNAEKKLEESKGDINTALLNMKAEINKKLKKVDEEYKLKQENLKAKINIVKEKIETFSTENINAILKNNTIKDKEKEVKELVVPTTITLSNFGRLSGILLNFVENPTLSSYIGLANDNILFPGYLNTAQRFVKVTVDYSFYGLLYKAWKYFHKKDDLIELIDKAKSEFIIEYDKFYLNENNLLDEYKKKIIDNFCISIYNIFEIENTFN